jgi:diguanylate cyclase (GGDEF)-like protein/PAS domain S-box-containing protein
MGDQAPPSSFATPLGILFLLPGIGALLALLLFFYTLVQTSDSLPFASVAGRVRMHCVNILYAGYRLQHSQARADRVEIEANVKETNEILEALRYGGVARGQRLSPLPVLVLDRWKTLDEAWHPFRDAAMALADRNTSLAEGERRLLALAKRASLIVDSVDTLLSTHNAWNRGLQNRMFLILLGVAALNLFSLVALRRAYGEAAARERRLAAANLDLRREMQERKRAEDQVYLAAQVFASSGEAIIITDPEARILSVNRAFTEITGYSLEEVVGQNPRILSSGRHDAAFYGEMWHTLDAEGYWQGEIWDRRKTGEIYPKWLGISTVRDPDGGLSHYVGIFTDITERKASEARISFLALHDALTGLPNRVLMRERANQALAHARRTGCRVAVLFLDLDRFKTINDSLGHPVGDLLLKEIASRLRAVVREIDTVCRLGGDEFLVLLGEIPDPAAVSQILDNLRLRIGETFPIEGFTLSTSFSIGVSLFPDDGEDFDTLLKNADTAAYAAKEAGRNTYRFFTEQMNAQAMARLWIETRLRQAVENAEFFLEYQPQYKIRDQRIIGVEALIRWQSPELGRVPPDQFIGIAEDSGIMVRIGEWVLREACRTAMDWQRRGAPPTVMAVNLSAVQLSNTDILATIAQTLADTGLDPHLLELELTESLLMRDDEAILATLQHIKSMGVRLAIDDFGTGYSSLSYLRRFAVDKIKVDRSFIRDLADKPDDRAIVRAIIQMAQTINLGTIAEGVEDELQLRYLEHAGCDEAQGYYFHRPLAPEVMFELLCTHQPRAVPSAPGEFEDTAR